MSAETTAVLIQVPPLTVAEWGALRSTLHTAGLVHQAVTVGPANGMLRLDSLPEPFRTVYRKVCDATRPPLPPPNPLLGATVDDEPAVPLV